MVRLCLALIPLAMLISLPLTAVLIWLGHRFKTFDSPGVPGQVKLERRRVPNTGGIAIFWAIALPVVAGLLLLNVQHWAQVEGGDAYWRSDAEVYTALQPHLRGIGQQTPLALVLIASLFVLHVMGLVDDRRPLRAALKLLVMLIPSVAIPALSDTRLMTMLDSHVGGPWLSILVTALWFLVVTNAMNFMDNMDGLSAGTAAVSASCFLAATLVTPRPQWFIAAMLSLLVGACLGFLVFNFPRKGGAKVYMGDGGSLVLGFLLAFLTVRTTYYHPEDGPLAGGWYGVFMPLVVLAVPLYDFLSVTVIRLSQGRSPLVGDTQHLSHRLERLGLSRPAAVLVIYGLTAVTGISGIALGSLRPWQAILVGVQTIALLLVVALVEFSRSRPPPGAR
jgi:UDP-GlcNAc:undecaprenyl-phosphate/decaprenyl-phosphate GlcNAc-1-phosphate transferase